MHRCALAAVAVALWASAAIADPIAINVRPVPLDPADPAHTRIGQLEYLGGVRLTSPDSRFGGLSDVSINAAGDELLALTDRGLWLSARFSLDGAGIPALALSADLAPMLDMRGKALVPPLSDAEGMVATPDGRIVSFERQHRLWLYPGAWPYTAAPVAVATPAGLANAPANGGVEAVVALADGRLVLFVEELKSGKGLAAWVQQPDGSFGAFTYLPAPGFAPTSAARLPSGDLLVLERKFTVFERAARVVRLHAADLVAGAELAGEELALIASPLTVDNFEGIAAVPEASGAVRVYLLSDNNLSVLERTLLLVFRLAN